MTDQSEGERATELGEPPWMPKVGDSVVIVFGDGAPVGTAYRPVKVMHALPGWRFLLGDGSDVFLDKHITALQPAAGYAPASALEAVRAELATDREGRTHLEEAAELLKRRPTIFDGIQGLYDWMQDVEAWKARDQSPTPAEAPSAEEPTPVAEAEARVTAENGGPCFNCGRSCLNVPKPPAANCPRCEEPMPTACDSEECPMPEPVDEIAIGALLDANRSLVDARDALQAKLSEAEREAVELRKERDKMRRQRDSALETVTRSESLCNAELGRITEDRDSLRSALTEAQAKLADLSYQLGKAKGEAEGHQLVRVGLEGQLQAQAGEREALLKVTDLADELSRWVIADEVKPGVGVEQGVWEAALRVRDELKALRAKPAQQASEAAQVAKEKTCGEFGCIGRAGHIGACPILPYVPAKPAQQADQKNLLGFRCPKCGSSYFTSGINPDKSMTRHCRHCDRQYPTGMWVRAPDGRRRCPSPSCLEWQWVGPT